MPLEGYLIRHVLTSRFRGSEKSLTRPFFGDKDIAEEQNEYNNEPNKKAFHTIRRYGL
jgi:hypothetical protein